LKEGIVNPVKLVYTDQVIPREGVESLPHSNIDIVDEIV